jgi:hypothetical protein
LIHHYSTRSGDGNPPNGDERTPSPMRRRIGD